MLTNDFQFFEKELRFFKILPPKKNQADKKQSNTSLHFIEPQLRKLHQTIRQVLKHYQYFSGYRKQELNLSQGDRVLRMNGIKVIKENDTYFIEKYISKEQNLLKRITTQMPQETTQIIRLMYCRSESLTDPRYFLNMLGYLTKQKEYFQYLQVQCYKCPAYGIEIVIYQKWDQNHYMMIDSVNNIEGFNPVSALLVDKLGDLVIEQNYNQIDPYTLRPKPLKHGIKPEL